MCFANAVVRTLLAKNFKIESVVARLDFNGDIFPIAEANLRKYSDRPIDRGHAPAGCAKIRRFVGCGHAAAGVAVVADPNGGILADFNLVFTDSRTHVFEPD